MALVWRSPELEDQARKDNLVRLAKCRVYKRAIRDVKMEIPAQLAAPAAGAALDLAVVIPTYNERDNVLPLLRALENSLASVNWEVIFVDDDSRDGTAEQIRQIAAKDRRVRILERVGRRGLASACIEGMLATPAPYIAVMDADFQHDESVLPAMLQRIKADQLDVVVASRNTAGGSMGEFRRVWLSQMGRRISRLVCRCDVSDPMSGFFVVDRRYFQLVVHKLTGAGFKILVDLLASSPRPVRFAEVGYRFRNRAAGESKLDVNVGLEYLFLIVDKLIGKYLPTRFVLFSLVGALGVAVHLTCLRLALLAHVSFFWAQAAATFVAINFNFVLNNTITFRDRRLRGWQLPLGWFTFLVACSLGALVNLYFSTALYKANFPWYVAGTAGLAVSSVWNYGVNTVLTWRRVRA
jgi:dolichol-phosphate mannosyltransferase